MSLRSAALEAELSPAEAAAMWGLISVHAVRLGAGQRACSILVCSSGRMQALAHQATHARSDRLELYQIIHMP